MACRNGSRTLILLALAMGAASVASIACRVHSTAGIHPLTGSLKAFLQRYEKEGLGFTKEQPRNVSLPVTTKYLYAFVSLHGEDKRQVLVYLVGNSWCGTSGCTTLVLEEEGVSYRVVSRLPGTRLPIRVLASRSDGWHDLGVWIQWGFHLEDGKTVANAGYESLLTFDGQSYPANSSLPPARHSENAPGETIFSSSDNGTPLYP
jgi:hypothetical protein